MSSHILFVLFFFFNDTATTEIYTLSLHDALPIYRVSICGRSWPRAEETVPSTITRRTTGRKSFIQVDRKSTRLNSSHQIISYAVFCLKKKKQLNLQRLLADNDRVQPNLAHPH